MPVDNQGRSIGRRVVVDSGSVFISGIGSVSLNVGDIEIGAVEIKDDDSGSRLDIITQGQTAGVTGIQIFGIDQSGSSIRLKTNSVGELNIGSISTMLPSGTNVIGSVVSNILSIATGTNEIGSVKVSSIIGALPSGTNILGSVILGNSAANIGSVIATVNVTLGSTFLVDQTTGSVLGVTKIGTADVNALTVQGNTSSIPFPVILGTSGSSVGSVYLNPSLNSIGSVYLDFGLNMIGSVYLMPSANTIGSVITTVNVGSVYIDNGAIGINTGTNEIGSVKVTSIIGALPTGTNEIGSVKANIISMSALITGTAEIGSVKSNVISLPSLITGTSEIGSVKVTSVIGALPTGTNEIGSVKLSANATEIGSVKVTSIIGALPAGTSVIGSVAISDAGKFVVGSIYFMHDDVADVNTWLNTFTGSGVVSVQTVYTGYTGSIAAYIITK